MRNAWAAYATRSWRSSNLCGGQWQLVAYSQMASSVEKTTAVLSEEPWPAALTALTPPNAATRTKPKAARRPSFLEDMLAPVIGDVRLTGSLMVPHPLCDRECSSAGRVDA